jgi:predicted nucleic acid-binding protein
MSTIVRGEVLHEIGRLNPGKKRAGLEREIEEIFAAIPSESLDDRMADFYAQIKVVRQRKGFPMDENDLWIAGTAKVFNAVLVTRDHDFQQVDGLVIEDWTQ